ncbi:TPA: 50S ribosomal protein L14 [candidate division WWE3 bacterium]|uniref:Large ribosomal subunit protein uL14 n=5 Tax=Katanobacteria TaxID=422282 RepID=A0A0G1MW41_UNCKA|nr:MAG: 50S ribosomal protein L14 [candidate division WWE3 bacterium GW2011_GWA2_44_16]KKT70151.1 MAG: 50S ribosomal protein L14 [candidate division WWE3 bacterium GW2011_GWB1_44_4]KKT85007.1 MAG: 50S ribosomal protein L14 [candidate division WWE3 bacterium GW2011_GWC2_44_9]OGC52239.1 MAG: 50S ribosomal protein L14 [candidate division WWE3 bacterium RIFCSPHIGHO2_01_FULL_43_9]HAZ29309.1 50S ribosomal protein L14 [candidate division WWE3 bacterium]
MLQRGTVFSVADNSGARVFKLIGIPGKSKMRFVSIGDVVSVAINGASSTGFVKDHSVVKVLIVRTRKEVRRKDGSYVRFDDNAGVVINDDGDMVATRVFGPVAREIRDLGYLKVASLAKEVW